MNRIESETNIDRPSLNGELSKIVEYRVREIKEGLTKNGVIGPVNIELRSSFHGVTVNFGLVISKTP